MRNERGVAAPSPLVMLSIIAVAMAGIAFVASKDAPETEKKITPISREATPTVEPTEQPEPTKKPEPKVRRAKVYVEVYNNTNVRGLAATTAQKVTDAGWQVVGTDNWVGTVPSTTVYFPKRLKAAAELLALDLGIDRTMPVVEGMKGDRLTVVLSG